MWTEVDSADTSATETDIVFGPITTSTSMQGQVVLQLDNLPSQHPHYSLIPTYVNQAKDELLTLGLAMNRQVIDHLPRLRNWRWYDVTTSGRNYMPLPERMLYLEAASYSKSTAAYDPSTTQLYPMTPMPQSSAQEFGLLSQASSSANWPTMYRRAGSRIEYWPTTQSTPVDYRTTVVVYGTRMDRDLSASADTLLMAPRLQLLVIDLAVVIAMEKMGWDEATERRAALESKLARLISPGSKERLREKVTTKTAGTP